MLHRESARRSDRQGKFYWRKEKHFSRAPFFFTSPQTDGRGTLFPSIASRLAINNVLFILPAAEIEWRVARADEVVDRGVLWKRKGTPDRRHYLPKLGSDATISAQRLHKERSEVCHC